MASISTVVWNAVVWNAGIWNVVEHLPFKHLTASKENEADLERAIGAVTAPRDAWEAILLIWIHAAPHRGRIPLVFNVIGRPQSTETKNLHRFF